MSASRAIPIHGNSSNGFSQQSVKNSFEPSTSPVATFHSPPSSLGARPSFHTPSARELKPFHTKDIKVLLLENVNKTGKDIMSGQGYQVESLKSSLPEDQLIEKIR